jgi:hypothetical protein
VAALAAVHAGAVHGKACGAPPPLSPSLLSPPFAVPSPFRLRAYRCTVHCWALRMNLDQHFLRVAVLFVMLISELLSAVSVYRIYALNDEGACEGEA